MNVPLLFRLIFFCGLLTFAEACLPEAPREYLFVGHPYDYNSYERLDPRVERLLEYPFDEIWLGGDVCAHTAASEENLAYLDSLMEAVPGEVHWTLGNHDVEFGPVERVLALRRRPAFYTTYQNGLCLMVLNTNLFWFYPSNPPQRECAAKEAQLEMVRSVADTIREASHLVVLHHHGLFTEILTDTAGRPTEAFNINARSIRATCDSASYANEVIYKELAKVQRRGVQVVCIGGDLGMVAKEFDYLTPEGISILGSGINNSLPRASAPDYVTAFGPDKVLWLEHWPSRRALKWRFVTLDSLVADGR